MTPAYRKKLLELISDLQETAEIYFDLGDGESNVSSQRTNEQLVFLSKIKYLAGFTEVLNENNE